jgi:hypothetical protein
MLSVSFSRVGKYSQALKFMEVTHHVVRGIHTLDYHQPRDMDYLLAVNTLTAYLLIRANKLEEALKCLDFAQTLIFLQVEYTLEESKPPQAVRYLNALRSIQDDLEEANKTYEIDVWDQERNISMLVESKESQKIFDEKTGDDERRRKLKDDALNRLKHLGSPPDVKKSKMSMTLI